MEAVRQFALRAIRGHPTLATLYAIMALHSLIFQAFIRLEQCAGFADCSTSLMKDVVWSLIWPIYWPAYWGYL